MGQDQSKLAIEDLNSSDIIILVVGGQAGVGKSTFINSCIGKNWLGARRFLNGGTHDIQQIDCTIATNNLWPRRTILVELPGIGPKHQSKVEEAILEWLKKLSSKNLIISGVLYLHRISDDFTTAPLDGLRRLFEDSAWIFPNCIGLVTTMWGRTSTNSALLEREKSFWEAWGQYSLAKSSSVQEIMKFESNDSKSAVSVLLTLMRGSEDSEGTQEQFGGKPRSKVSEVDMISPPSTLHPGPSSVLSRPQTGADIERRKSLVSRLLQSSLVHALPKHLKGTNVQLVVDQLSHILDEGDMLDPGQRKGILNLLCRIAKSAQVFPKNFELTGVDCNFNQPVDEGAFGVIYKGNYLGEMVCIKAVRMYQVGARIRALRAHAGELVVGAYALHPNVLPFLGAFISNEPTPRMCIVSPWMEGGNLVTYLHHYPDTPRIGFVSDILLGLQYLHEIAIIHADLKGSNVLVSQSKRAILADFGVSRIAMTSAGTTTGTESGGTPNWMAPELLTSDEPPPATRESDIWSFGCVCYEILAGKIPFEEYKPVQLIRAFLSGNNPTLTRPISIHNISYANEIWSIAKQCLRHDPSKRLTTDEALKIVLRLNVQDERPPVTTDPRTSVKRPRSTREFDYDALSSVIQQDGQTYEVSLLLDKAASPALKPPVSLSGSGVLDEPSGSDTEPSVEQLLAFCETLKSRKVTLYANTSSAFTRHITSYLAAWSMDINHVFSENSNETSIPGASKTAVLEARLSAPTNPVAPTPEAAPITASRPAASENQPQISFVLIDDDVGILREQLHALRVEQHPLNLNARARPSLAALHRPRSSSQIARVLEQSASTGPSSIVILHFTSLANFKAAKDVVQSVMSTHFGGTSPLPEVMIIPKPVGPRRFLTVMHTAVTRPPIDSFFTPTATSPGTPSVQASGSFFPAPPDPSSSNQTSQMTTPFNRAARPQGARSDSERSSKEHTFVNLPSPSPLGMPDNVEHFPGPAGKLGPSSSSGFIVSSPDGQPAGIFFYPRTKKNASPQAAERIDSQSTIQRRGSVQRLFSGREGDAMSFSAPHEASQPPDEATSAAGSPKIPASSTQDGTLTPGRRPPHESPVNESGPSRKAIAKRPVHEKQDSVGTGVQKGGNATTSADGNIVPPISVLIVDDNPINQTILSMFMKRKRIRYGIANNGKEAVEKWKNGDFHLILMDIQMPNMDGIEATREIRRLEALNATSGFPPLMPSQTQLDASIPVSVSTSNNDLRPTSTSSPYRSSVIIVALTASSLQNDRVNALAAGCNDCLTKPVSLLWLNNKIIEWGSIKALQMWADIRPEPVRKLSRGQAAQARAVAARLRMPQSRNQPAKQLPISGMIVPPTTATTTSIPSTGSSHEARDGSGDNTPTIPDPTTENPAATPSNIPKRRRSQKRESAPESVKAKAVVALEDHDTPCVSMVRVNNGTPAVTGQDQDHPLIPKTEAEEPEPIPGPDQAPLIENLGPR